MASRRLIPYFVVLIVLAFALGSLPRGSTGGSLLFRSWWLLYLIYLTPVVVLGMIVALTIFVALNWRNIGGFIGINMAQKKKQRKPKSRYSILVWLIVWAVAIVVLLEKPGTIFNHNPTNSTVIASIQGAAAPLPNPFQLGGILPSISGLFQNDWFSVAFLGLIVVGGLVLVEGVRVALKETNEMTVLELKTRQIEGLQAAQNAVEVIDNKAADPRTRIITCFQYMVAAVSRFGVPVSPDQTARELEKAIRSTFALKGAAINELTQLFEEARYSLHEINDEDAANARQSLVSIEEELKIQLDS